MKTFGPALFILTLVLTGCGESNNGEEHTNETTEEVNEDTTADNASDEDSNDDATDAVDEVTNDDDDESTNPDEETEPGSRPESNYACEINSNGFCIFTGTPHQTGLEPGTSNIVNRDGVLLFALQESVAANSAGTVLTARGTPAFEGDDMIESSHASLSSDEIAFHRVMATMFPIRNALMYDIEELTQDHWDELVSELELRGIKETTYTDGPTPPDNYYGRQGVFDLAKNPGGRDIHHEVMKFLEESGLYLLCHVTSDEFGQMLADTHPAGHEPCVDADITTNIPF